MPRFTTRSSNKNSHSNGEFMMWNDFTYSLMAVGHGDEQPASSSEESLKGKYPCPCCKCIMLPVPPEEATAYICPVCFWENDVFISGDDEESDENHGMTLNEARANYRKIGACSPDLLKHVRKPKPEEVPK